MIDRSHIIFKYFKILDIFLSLVYTHFNEINNTKGESLGILFIQFK